MTYFVQNSDSEHLTALESVLQDWINEPQDISFISRDGDMVYSQQSLLSLHSPLLARVFGESEDACPGVCVDASSTTITTLVDILAYGKAATNNKSDLEKVKCFAATLGIRIANLGIDKVSKSGLMRSSVNKSEAVRNASYKERRLLKVTIKPINFSKPTSGFKKQETDCKDKETAKYNNITVTRTLVPSMKLEKRDVNERILRTKTCVVCLKSFKYRQGLNKHLKNNTCKGIVVDQSKLFQCNKCGKSYDHKKSLKRHKILHKKNLPYKCGECGKTFSQAGNLKAHAKSKHNIELSVVMRQKDIVEHQSKQDLTSRDDTYVKEEIVNGDDTIVPGPSPAVDGKTCSVCSKTFQRRWGLTKHLKGACKGKIDYSVKLFNCDDCGMAFGLKHTLKRHKLVHTRDICYRCEECGQTFGRPNHLRMHAKTQHNIDLSVVVKSEDTVSEESKEEETDIMSGEDNLSNGGFVNNDQTEEYNEYVNTAYPDYHPFNGGENNEGIEDDAIDQDFNEEAAYPAVSLFCEEFENVVFQEAE